MSGLHETSNLGEPQDTNDDSSFMETIDIGLGVVSTTEGQLRFNQEDIYIARETAVLARCSLVECVHGNLSIEDPVPCTLLVFDFQLDRIKTSRVIHSAIITLVTHNISRIHSIAPKQRLNVDALELQVERRSDMEGELGIDNVVKATATPKFGKTTQKRVVRYASARGWTTHYPHPRPNDISPHDCIKWSIQENPANKEEGVPPHFRAAVLLERCDADDEFHLEMEVDSTADLLTGLEDLSLKSVEKGRLTIKPTNPSTCRLKQYGTELGKENMDKIALLSLGVLQDNVFD